MADNVVLDPGTGGATVAADELSYSGDTAKVSISRLVHVTGAEGTKTLHEILFAEDAVHTSGDYGLQMLAVRKDTAAALAGADGDYTPLISDASGRLHVAPLPANSGVDIGDVTLNNGFASVVGGGVEATALRVTIASDSTGVVSVDDNGASLTVDNAALSVTGGGVEASAIRVTIASDSTGVLSVDDNSGSLTIDNAALSVTGGGVEATALRVTLASDSTGVVSIDDNGGALTVDHAALDLLHTADFDSGVGTDTTPAIGIAVAASGGAAVITGDVANGLDVDVTRVGGDVTVIGAAADGAAASGNPVQVAGKTVGGTAQTLATDDDGELIIHQKAGSTALADDQSNTTSVPLIEDETSVMYTPTVPYMFDGTAWDRVRGTSADGLLVNLGTNNDVTITTIAAGDNNIGNVDIVTVPAPLSTTGGGTEATALRVTVASDSTGVLSIDDNGGTLTVDNNGTFATQAQLTPITSGGLSASKTISAATTNSTNVKASAGQLYELFVSNINAAVRYLKLYDKATAPTVGTDIPVWTLAIPGNTAGAGFAKTIPNGLAFASGIGFGLTTGVADADTGAVAASELVVNLGYK